VPRLMLLTVLLGACSDYSFAEKQDRNSGSDTGSAPDIRVDPGELSLSGVCGSVEDALVVTNVGDADLDVLDATTDGTACTVDTSGLPATLSPGASLELPVLSGTGTATVHVHSSDPDQPTVSIPLSASGDSAPTVTITSPSDGAVLAVGGTELTAEVTDAEQSPETLQMSWQSDVDGVFDTRSPDATGVAEASWRRRSSGPHILTATATDQCGNTGQAIISVCQDRGYTADELDIADWQFEGSARWDTDHDWLELTPPTTNQVGAAFATDSVVSGDSVEIRFNFFIGEGTGADGLSLTALDTDRMTGFLGGTGCGIGYGGDAPCTAGPALPGWSIEVDTYFNGDADPTDADHLMFTFDGDVDGGAIWAELPEMEDTGWHEMVVTVTAPHVRVDIDGTTYIDDDLSGHFSFPAYVGFTAGTGGQTNRHLIDALQVTESVCE